MLMIFPFLFSLTVEHNFNQTPYTSWFDFTEESSACASSFLMLYSWVRAKGTRSGESRNATSAEKDREKEQ
jgi:hypothetical protein